MSRAAFQIEDDVPARRLVFVWQGAPPRALFRWAALAVGLLILVGAALFAYYEAVPVIRNQGQQPGGDPLGMAVLAVLMVGGSVIMAFWVFRGGGDCSQYVKRLAWDAADGTLEVTQGGWMLFGTRRQSVPLAAIRSIELTVGSETAREGLPVQLQVAFDERGEHRDLKLALPVEGVARRREALDVAYRIARIAERPKYMVLRSDPRELKVALLTAAGPGSLADDAELDDDDEDEDDVDDEIDANADELATAAPVVRKTRPAADEIKVFDVPPVGFDRGDAADDRPGFAEPKVQVPPLDAGALAEGAVPSRLIEWDPPRYVQTSRDALPRAVLVVVAVIFAIAGAIVGAWPFNGFAAMFVMAPPSRWQTAAFAGMIGTMLGTFLVWAFNRKRDVTIDADSRTITCRQGEQVRTYSWDEVCEVTLIGQQSRDAEQQTQYLCRIELGVGQQGEWAFDSGEAAKSADGPYRKLLPLSIELARMLNVPWRWQEYRESVGGTWFQQLGWKERAVVAGLVGSLLGYVIMLRAGEQGFKDARPEVEAAGAEVSFLNGYTIRDQRVLENYWKVSYESRPFDNDQLRTIAPFLKDMGRVGVYLGGTPVDDAGLKALAEVDNLLLLELHSSQITSEGLESLNGLNELVYLGVANTAIGDAGLERLAPLQNLRFLSLATTQVTDAGLKQLLKFPKLEWVGLGNLRLSPAAIDELQRQRPRLVIMR